MSKFNNVVFDSWYPDEEGKKKARERLWTSALYANAEGLTPHEWEIRIKGDSELTYYLDLIGGERMLNHISYVVLFTTKRQY
jgi:hypothetical protein